MFRTSIVHLQERSYAVCCNLVCLDTSSRYEGEGRTAVNAPRFLDTRHMKVVWLSALRTGSLYPQEYPGTHFVLEAESTPGHMDLSDASEKFPIDTTGDRSRDLPTSSAAP